jgi:hypothetical protein
VAYIGCMISSCRILDGSKKNTKTYGRRDGNIKMGHKEMRYEFL